MEFRNLFIEYKIEIKKLDKTCKRVPWKKLPWQNKFLSILILVITIAWVTFYLTFSSSNRIAYGRNQLNVKV